MLHLSDASWRSVQDGHGNASGVSHDERGGPLPTDAPQFEARNSSRSTGSAPHCRFSMPDGSHPYAGDVP